MASGKTHAKVGLFVIGGSLGSFLFVDPLLATSFVLGTVNGWLVTPDADVDHTTHEEKRLEKIPVIGKLVRIAFQTFWYPYALAFDHRGYSHKFILGTASRFLYQNLLLLCIFACPLGGWWVGVDFQKIELPYLEILVVALIYFLGWVVQDSFHLLFDR